MGPVRIPPRPTRRRMLMVAGTLIAALGIFLLGAVFGTPLRE